MDKVKMLLDMLDRLIEESECQERAARPDTPPYTPPKCWKCGTTKRVDLFKGEYCPRCNDWC